ncbi:MAG: heavy-metal-associated domain-containing protein [Flavobacteriales bacterium]|nr:heavy-metal-associated domain-containing protein [Flavobacteriales bacterium]
MDKTTITLPLLDVNSPHCALRVEKAIRTVPAITAADVDLDAHVAHLTSSEPAQALKEAVAAIRQAGYQVATDQRTFDTTGHHMWRLREERDHHPERIARRADRGRGRAEQHSDGGSGEGHRVGRHACGCIEAHRLPPVAPGRIEHHRHEH